MVDNDGNVMVSSTPLSRTAHSEETIEELKDRVKNLENTVEDLKQLLLNRNNTSSSDIPVLFQNTPNPTTNETVIRYYLPENVRAASVEMYSMSGQLVKTISLYEKGNGAVRISKNDLPSGNYIYKMTVNGKVTDSKKMIIQD